MRRWLLPAISVGLFALSLCLPAVDFWKGCGGGAETGRSGSLFGQGTGPMETWFGWELFLRGPLAIMVMQPGALGWLATPVGAVVLVLRGLGRRVPLALPAAAVVLAILGPYLTDLFPLPVNDGNACHLAAAGPRLGYWVWLMAIVVAALSAWPVSRNHTAKVPR